MIPALKLTLSAGVYPRYTKFLNDSKQSAATVHKHPIQITISCLYIVTSFNYSYIYNISKSFLFYIIFVASLHDVMLLLMYNLFVEILQ